MSAALTKIRCLEIDLVDLLLLFGNNDREPDGEQKEDHEVNCGRDDIGLSP